jgi:site-specific DNA-methyltransferase (adenine-specific)
MQCKKWMVREGNSLEVMNQLAPGSLDGVVTDPPYCSGGRTSSERLAPPSKKYLGGRKAFPEFLGDDRDQRGFLAWCSLWLASAWRATREGGVLVAFIDWRMLPTMSDAVQAGGWIWRDRALVQDLVPATARVLSQRVRVRGLGEQGTAAARTAGKRRGTC